MTSGRFAPILAVLAAVLSVVTAETRGVDFDRIVIDNDFPGAYQVEVADINGDRKPDVVAVGGGTCAWYENPTWKKRIVTGPRQTPGIISSASADLDGDGKAEIAIAYEFEMNNPRKGKLLLAVQDKDSRDGWSTRLIDDVPSIHRLRWGRIFATDGPQFVRPPNALDLVVAPIFGPSAQPPAFDQENARLGIYLTGPDPKAGRWSFQSLPGGGQVLHAIEVQPGPKRMHEVVILAANHLGVMGIVPSVDPQGTPSFAAFDVFPIPEGSPPKRGCSEVHLGKLANGREFLATIEPWHGSIVAVRFRNPDPPGTHVNLNFGPRAVLDDTLDEGHALWVVDIDGDGDAEVFAGHRGKDHRISLYDFNGKTKTWERTVIDREIAAQDLRGGDLDGDGTADVVAVGGKTHNVVWYRPRKRFRP